MDAPFSVIKEDLEHTLFLTQLDLLKSLHIEHGVMEFEKEVEQWNAGLSKIYDTSIDLRTSYPVEIQSGNIHTIQAKMHNLFCDEILISFHALPISAEYLIKFASREQKNTAHF